MCHSLSQGIAQERICLHPPASVAWRPGLGGGGRGGGKSLPLLFAWVGSYWTQEDLQRVIWALWPQFSKKKNQKKTPRPYNEEGQKIGPQQTWQPSHARWGEIKRSLKSSTRELRVTISVLDGAIQCNSLQRMLFIMKVVKLWADVFVW